MRDMKGRAASRPSQRASSTSVSGLSTLPAWKAFVVQFSTETSTRTGIFSGRVEHLNSGRRARFVTRQELLLLLERLLGEIEDASP